MRKKTVSEPTQRGEDGYRKRERVKERERERSVGLKNREGIITPPKKKVK